MRKDINFGIDKSKIKIDKSRINWDYILGMIATDGHLRHREKQTGVVITQNNIEFIKSLQDFFTAEGFKTGIYMDGRQVSGNKDLYEFVMCRAIENYDSYYAGVIDGDGSFCSHKSSSGDYWRFNIASNKKRKLTVFNEMFFYFNLIPIRWEGKSEVIYFGIQRAELLIKLIRRIQDYVIIKKDVLELITPKISKFLSDRK